MKHLFGEVPSDWKKGHITPIPEKGSKEDTGVYRLVSLTSVRLSDCYGCGQAV